MQMLVHRFRNIYSTYFFTHINYLIPKAPPLHSLLYHIHITFLKDVCGWVWLSLPFCEFGCVSVCRCGCESVCKCLCLRLCVCVCLCVSGWHLFRKATLSVCSEQRVHSEFSFDETVSHAVIGGKKFSSTQEFYFYSIWWLSHTLLV